MPGGFLIGELGGRLVQGKIPESGRTAEQGQPVQNGKAGQHAALQPGEPGHMGYAVPSAAQVYPAAYAALDMLFPMAFQDGRGGNAVHHHIRRPGGGRAVPVPLDVQITAGSRSQAAGRNVHPPAGMVKLRRAGHQGKLRASLERKEQPPPLHFKPVLAGTGVIGALHAGSVQNIRPAGLPIGNGQGINAPLFQTERIRQNILFRPAPGPFRLFPETERHGSEPKLQLRNIDGGNDKRALQQLPAAEFRLNVPGLKGSQKLMPLHRYAAAPDAGTVPVKRVYPGGLHIHIINGGLFQHG